MHQPVGVSPQQEVVLCHPSSPSSWHWLVLPLQHTYLGSWRCPCNYKQTPQLCDSVSRQQGPLPGRWARRVVKAGAADGRDPAQGLGTAGVRGPGTAGAAGDDLNHVPPLVVLMQCPPYCALSCPSAFLRLIARGWQGNLCACAWPTGPGAAARSASLRQQPLL